MPGLQLLPFLSYQGKTNSGWGGVNPPRLGLNKYSNRNNVINIKWFPIEKRIEYSLAIIGFEAICDENVPNHLKSTQKVACTRNLQSNNKVILINVNQQSKTFEKHTKNIFNKLPTNIQSVAKLLVFKSKVKTYFLDQALAKNFKDLIKKTKM